MCFFCLFFSFSGRSNRKIKNIIYMLPFSERVFVTSRLHLTSVFNAVGMFSTVDDSQSCTEPLQSRSFKSLFAARLRLLSPGFDYME